jgi:hypothetical protein
MASKNQFRHKVPKNMKSSKDSKKQKPLIPPIDRLKASQGLEKNHQPGKTTYKPSYDKIVLNLLASEGKTKAHCCNALRCSPVTLDKWIRDNPSFRAAIETGLEIGKMMFMKKIQDHAFEPSKQVNNGLIKLLASNIYGIREDPQVIINNENSQTNNDNVDPEQKLKDRGIPIPEVEIDDVDE